MTELIRRYIEDSQKLISKQASEMKALEARLEEARKSTALDKQAAEDALDEVRKALGNGHYTQDSVFNAVLHKDVGCLVKQATSQEYDDSLGELVDNDGPTKSNNIRQSEQKLYSRLGLI